MASYLEVQENYYSQTFIFWEVLSFLEGLSRTEDIPLQRIFCSKN